MRGTRFQLGAAAALCLAVVSATCGPAVEPPAPAASEADLEAINKLRQDFVSARNTGDTAGLLGLWTDDGVWMRPNETAIVGREALELRYLNDEYSYEFTVSSEEVEVAGDWGFDRGTYTVTLTPKGRGEQAEDTGSYVAISNRQSDGSWKVARLITNSDNPLPAVEE